ncbi:MAG: hypothetical protein L7S72_12115, partial [Flavobacteriales bacterium]|nr:hypothetical protein [Flavobacteriales bacterium]
MASRPTLTEPGVKYFLGETLKNCKKNKDIFNVQLFNLGLFLGFLCIVTALLVYKYKTKPGPEELKKKATLKRDYFINKVKQLQADKARLYEKSITNLPK